MKGVTKRMVFGFRDTVGSDHNIVSTKAAQPFRSVNSSVVFLPRPDRIVEPLGTIHVRTPEEINHRQLAEARPIGQKNRGAKTVPHAKGSG
jgi:hypothetical protein